MQQLITWWCNLIGITDPVGIAVALGTVGGLTAILAASCLASILGLALVRFWQLSRRRWKRPRVEFTNGKKPAVRMTEVR